MGRDVRSASVEAENIFSWASLPGMAGVRRGPTDAGRLNALTEGEGDCVGSARSLSFSRGLEGRGRDRVLER